MLSFGELLGFLHQLVETDAAFHEAVDRALPAVPRRQNDSTWDAAGTNGGGVAVKVSRTLDTRDVVADATIRRLFQSIALEPAPLFSTTSPSPPTPALARTTPRRRPTTSIATARR